MVMYDWWWYGNVNDSDYDDDGDIGHEIAHNRWLPCLE